MTTLKSRNPGDLEQRPSDGFDNLVRKEASSTYSRTHRSRSATSRHVTSRHVTSRHVTINFVALLALLLAA